jgi:cobyrinic acid a,c-diamide synthase
MPDGLILAAPRSGSGKTIVTLALIGALRRHGIAVAAAKAGPDYIDAAFLAAAAGSDCINLDAWAMRPATLAAALAAQCGPVLCEGAMGLFDGIGATGDGSTAALAALTGWPVVLTIDAGGMGASVAALAAGFARHRRDTEIGGVILNRVGSERHRALLAAALAAELPEVPLLGALPRAAELALPSRHLGLVQAKEHADLPALLERTAALDGWRAKRAALTFFSPLANEAPARDADAVFLPGGYPELHAGRIAAAENFRGGLAAAAARGAAIYGECGGYMVLGRGLIDAEGARHEMARLLPLETSFADRRLHLGYRAARLMQAGPLGAKGARYRGHEFHYATIVDEATDAPLFELADGEGTALAPAGAVAGNAMGSFVHLVDRAP